MKPLISVLIVEPSEIIVEGLSAILDGAGGYNILSPLHDVSLLEERLPVIRPDLLVVNPTLWVQNPRMQLAAIAAQRPKMKTVALVYQYVDPSLLECFRHVLDIRMTRSSMLSLLKTAVDEKNIAAEQSDSSEDYELSDRETDVLVLVAKGLSSKEIADRLNISVHTVNSHRKNITHKTGIKSVAGLAVYAMIHNLME